MGNAHQDLTNIVAVFVAITAVVTKLRLLKTATDAASATNTGQTTVADAVVASQTVPYLFSHSLSHPSPSLLPL